MPNLPLFPMRRALVPSALCGLCVFCLVLPSLTSALERREWTDVKGRKIPATLVGLESDKALLELADGRRLPFPLANLSAADKTYIQVNTVNLRAISKTNTATQKASSGMIVRGGGPSALTTWPTAVKLDSVPEVTTVKEDKDSKQFIYTTEHFEFQSDVRLGAAVVREFARIFESTYLLNCLFPMNFAPAFEDGRERFKAILFETEAAYSAAGGPAGSAGVYRGAEKVMMLPLSSLGVKVVGQRVLIDHDVRDYDTLIHEITHQMMNRWLPYLPVWYAEGSATYTELLDYGHGRFSLNNLRGTLKEAFGRETAMLAPSTLMQMSYEKWAAALTGGGARLNYQSANLLAVYFYHADGDGKATNLIQYLKDIDAGVAEPEAAEKNLLRGRTPQKFDEDVKIGLARLGVKVTFP